MSDRSRWRFSFAWLQLQQSCLSLAFAAWLTGLRRSRRARGRRFSNPQTIVDLQPFRQTGSIAIKGAAGRGRPRHPDPAESQCQRLVRAATVMARRYGTEEYHLENASPRTQKLLLEEQNPYGLVVVNGEKKIPASSGEAIQGKPEGSQGLPCRLCTSLRGKALPAQSGQGASDANRNRDRFPAGRGPRRGKDRVHGA